MKYFISLIFLLSLLCSCGPNVAFINPQPIFLDNLKEIPEEYQGSFFDLQYPNEDPIIVTENSIEINGIELDSFVVKSQGNYLYFNIVNPDGYFELYVARIVSYMGEENIQVMTVSLDKEDLKYFDLEFIKYDDDREDDYVIEGYVLDDLNVNQLNLYRKLGYEDIKKQKRFSSQFKKVK
tara:strand:+ start:69 stop:608 length:540 start_codon:yes stop_codon:yes gene_type:complete